MRQQACKTQIPPHNLKQRRCPQFRLIHRATAPNSDCPPSLAGSRRLHLVRGRIHPGSNAASVTPHEPIKFTKMGEATIDMGRKLGDSTAFLEGGAGSPSNTMLLASRPTSLPSDILFHPAIWSQQIRTENWGLFSFGGGELGPHLTQCGQGRGLPACQVPS